MKKYNLLFASLLFLFPNETIAQERAIIKIDTDRVIDQINPHLYGNFSEHLGQGIYGGIYDPKSIQADEDGFRKDVIEQTKELKVSILRWPGGNFVSGYHWEDGIGDRSKRPTRIDLAWGGKESNMIGTDEFIQFARKAKVEPYFCVNLGTGSLDEARNWVEYCNVEKGTYYSDLRRKNGFEKPHKVTYWGLGNEVDGPWQMGHKSPEDYSKMAIETAKLMRWIDKDIKLIASGSSNYDADWNKWNRTILDEMYNYIDYISLHHYSHNTSDYYTYLTNTIEVENYIRIVEQQIKEAVEKFKNTITDNGGTIEHEEAWGLRKLAYPIQKKTTGFYHLLQFEAEGALVDKLETAYRRDERVIRFLTFRLDKYAYEYTLKRRSKYAAKQEEK